jgi:ligand-binding sensor domain-containing protein
MNSRFLRQWLYVIFVFFTMSEENVLYARDENRFNLYTALDGLSNDHITGIVQDTYGYMWIATPRGLNRYDGKNIVQFRGGNGYNALPDENITDLVWLNKTRLAVCTDLGLRIINTLHGETNDIIIPAFNQKYLHKFNRIMAVLSDRQGNIYLLTRSGFYHYDAHYRLIFRFDYYTREQTPTTGFAFGNSACWLSAEELVITTIDGAYTYNTQRCKLYPITGNHPLLPELAIPHSCLMRQTTAANFILIKNGTDSIFYIDSKLKRKVGSAIGENKLVDEFDWSSTLFRVNDSLFYLSSRQNGFFKVYINPATGKARVDPKRYLSDYRCNDFHIGGDNRLWVATNTGLLKETENITSVQQVSLPPDVCKRAPAVNIRQLLCFRDKLYVACSGNGGLLVFDKKTLSFLYKVDLKKYLEEEYIYSILQAREDTLFIGSDGFLLWLKTGTNTTGIVELEGWDKAHNWVAGQLKDRRGNIWVFSNDSSKMYQLAAGAGRFRRLHYDTSIFSRVVEVSDIKEDSAGNIWASGHGVCRIRPASGIPEFYMDSFPHIRFQRTQVSAIGFDRHNTLWAGIVNNGLAGYDMKKDTFRHFTTSDGLPDNYIKALYSIGNKLWIATTSGIAVLNLVTNRISKFSEADGFSSLPVSSKSFFYDADARYLYSGFTKYIVRFNPDSLLYPQSPPSFFIESLHLLNDTTYYHPGSTISIPYNRNDLTVTIGCISYHDAESQRIAYRIANTNDMSWQLLSGNQINFNNLPPGSYYLQVKLFAANNRWPDQVTAIRLIINPPFWKTAWFTGLMALSLLSLIYIIYRVNINMVRKAERAKRDELAWLNQQLAEAQLAALQAQMNPHFIFNALNSIKRMILDDENRDASKYLSRFALMIRLTLDHSRETFVTLQETIEYLRAYLDMEQLRFGSSFSYIIETKGMHQEDDSNIPTLMIQPLVENAIWHGLMHRKGDKKIVIRFVQNDDRITCTIKDNGIGIRQSEKKRLVAGQSHVGLENLRNRIKIMNEKYHLHCTLNISDLGESNMYETGTLVVLQFKIKAH